jgi:hypothetical protein
MVEERMVKCQNKRVPVLKEATIDCSDGKEIDACG